MSQSTNFNLMLTEQSKQWDNGNAVIFFTVLDIPSFQKKIILTQEHKTQKYSILALAQTHTDVTQNTHGLEGLCLLVRSLYPVVSGASHTVSAVCQGKVV